MKRERNDAVQTVLFSKEKNFEEKILRKIKKNGGMSVIWNLFLCIVFDLSLFRGSLAAFYGITL